MKCDELQYERLGDANKTYTASTLVIRKQFVDAAITELKDENRRLKRALWLVRAAMCKMEKDRWSQHIDVGNLRNRKDPAYIKKGKLLTVSQWCELWANNERKCRAKAEEYK